MRFVTFAEADRDCAGVLDSGQVHALPPGVRLIDLIGDPGRLEEAGDRALRRPHAVHARGSVRLRAPIPSPPSDLYRALADAVTFNGGPMQTAV